MDRLITSTALKMESTVFHELGHIVGFIFANKTEETHLGEFELELGVIDGSDNSKKYRVVTLSDIYSADCLTQESINRVNESTKNIKRTTAYIVKGLLGAVFQAIKDGKSFEEIFTPAGSAGKDFINLGVLRRISVFKWDNEELNQIGVQLKATFEKHNIEDLLGNITQKLTQKTIPEGSLTLSGNEIEKLTREIQNALTEKLYEDWKRIIEKWESAFTQRVK
jgi:hypothetical protein